MPIQSKATPWSSLSSQSVGDLASMQQSGKPTETPSVFTVGVTLSVWLKAFYFERVVEGAIKSQPTSSNPTELSRQQRLRGGLPLSAFV